MVELTLDAIAAAKSQLNFPNVAVIDGLPAHALSGETFTAENPATGEILCHIPAMDAADVELAVASARRAFESGVWSQMAPAERRRTLHRFADLIEQHTLELALLECLEAGKPISECINTDIPETAECIRWHGEATDKRYDQICPTDGNSVGMVVREPIGVVAAVLPWNFPAQMAAWKLGPVLSTGNSIIIKPAEQSSLSTVRLAQLALEAGIPAGVFNVVTGFGETAGEALGLHNDVDVCAFTGSTEVGRKFLAYSAQSNLKRIVLELGGKSPQIVMPDAVDLPYIATQVANHAFWNMGENCTCGSRLIVHESIKEALLDELINHLNAEWTLGDPLNPNTRLGALVEKAHLEKVLSYIALGQQEGGRVRFGGEQVLKETGGYFVQPTIVDNVENHFRIAQEEIFGPVLSVITFRDEQEAINIANDTIYGLASSVYTENIHTAHRMAHAIKAGLVSINGFSEGDATAPFGGYKQSGFSGRDKSLLAHDQYTQVKTIWQCMR